MKRDCAVHSRYSDFTQFWVGTWQQMELFQFCRTDGQPAHLHFPAGYISPSRTALTINPVHLQECFQKILLDGRKMARERFSLKKQDVGWGCVSRRTFCQHLSTMAELLGPKLPPLLLWTQGQFSLRPNSCGGWTSLLLKPKRRRGESLLVKLPHWHYFWRTHMCHLCCGHA